METLGSYMIKSIIGSGVLYLYYQIALKNKKFHNYNRFYLLLSIVISLAVPFINFDWLYIEESENTTLTNFVHTINSPISNQHTTALSTGMIVFSISALASITLLLLLVSRIIWIYRIKKTNRNIEMQGFTVIETSVKQAPFSFLNNLFWKDGLSATDENGARIFKHELTHIFQKHSYDKLFTQIVFCIFWMNPFHWLIQKELNTIHEFIADANAVEDGDTESFARMLLHSHNQGSYLSPSHRFFNSSIKRRLVMISTSSKTQYSYTRRILALPIILFVLAVLTISVKAQTDSKNVNPVKENQNFVTDTIPKFETSLTKAKEPVTVQGKKLNKNSDQKPQKTNGKKFNSNSNVETTIITEQNVNVNADIQTTTEVNQKTDIAPVQVTGHKLVKTTSPDPITVTVEQSDIKPVIQTTITVSDQSPQSADMSPKKVKGKQSPKKSKEETNPVSKKKFE